MRQIFLCAAFAVSLLGSDVSAGESPRWELGLGMVGLSFPDYRGSDQRRSYLLPLPYIQYRGDVIRIDREGAHGIVFTSDRVKADLSVNAGPPARSGDNDARRGMPDIDPTAEVGPSLEVFISRDRTRNRVWSLRMPMRAAIASDFTSVRHIGWVFAPSLEFDADQVGGGWNFGIGIGPTYASEAYHDYYYEVQQVFATPDRSPYNARAGYSGSRLTLTATRRFPGYWVGAFARYDDLSGAVFADSPLVKKKESFMVGIGIAWILAESK